MSDSVSPIEPIRKSQPLLSARNIVFRYPGAATEVLDGVDIDLYASELLVLAGENGAGKTTLGRLLSGSLTGYVGSIETGAGVRSIYLPQHLHAIPDTPLHEYLWPYLDAGNPAFRGWWPMRKRIQALTEVLENEFSACFDPSLLEERVSMLSSNLLHLFTSAAQLSRADASIHILDEPTAVLSEQESAVFYRFLRRQLDRGKAIVLITHRIEEAYDEFHRIAVVNRGKIRGVLHRDDKVDIESIQEMMFAGTSFRGGIQGTIGEPSDHCDRRSILRIENISATFPDLCPLDDIDLTVHRGEILAISGIRDEGLEQLERILSGRSRPDSGSIHGGDPQEQISSMEELRRSGGGFVPSDRKRYGSAPDLTAWENLAAGYLLVEPPHLKKSYAATLKKRMFQQFGDGGLDLNSKVSEYSGGMLQRLILQREMDNIDFAILANPGWGLDARFRASLGDTLQAMTAGGAGILLLTTELGEALEYGHRIGLIHQGRLFFPDQSEYSSMRSMESYFLGSFHRSNNNA